MPRAPVIRLLLGLCLLPSSACAAPPLAEVPTVTPAPATSAVTVSIHRAGDAVAWSLRNDGDEAIWAFLLIPSVSDGAMSFARDSAWMALDGTALLLRKVAIAPPDVPADPMDSGAVRLEPGEQRTGEIALGATVRPRLPYQRGRGVAVRPSTVALEIGYVRASEAGAVVAHSEGGLPYAEVEIRGGLQAQRLARSAPIPWGEGG